MKAENPYKKGTMDFLIWQEAYLAGQIDRQFEIILAYLNAKIGDSTQNTTCTACNGTGYIK